MHIDVATDIDNINKTIELAWETAISKGWAVAIWRLPNTKEVHFLANFSGKLSFENIDFEETRPGFAFNPFLSGDKNLPNYLFADLYLKFSSEKGVENKGKYAEETIAFLDTISKYKVFKKPKNDIHLHFESKVTEQNRFKQLINAAKIEIDKTIFQKIVLSRIKEVNFSKKIPLPHFFTKLAKVYPFAFVSAIYLPDTKVIWLGASPELLVSKNEKGIFKTMSLAGTQSAFDASGNHKNPNHALWSQKEIEEQSFVSRYIIECFKKIRVREYIETGPKTIEAGNLFHLRTDYLVDAKAINFTEMATVMLKLLHPTSAVCGTPKTEALNFILANEGYEREYYSGFLGPVNIEDQSSLFVNLRTMKIEGEKAKIFAGAGITEDSDAENEWLETEMKTNTLLSIFE